MTKVRNIPFWSCSGECLQGQGRPLWQQHQQSDALDSLLCNTQAHNSKVCKAAPTLRRLKDIVEKVGGQVDAQDGRILQLGLRLKQQDQCIRSQILRIEVLEKNASKAVLAKEKRQQRVLLGQAAYALAKIIEQYVYGPAGFPHGLGLPVSLNKISKDLVNFLPEQKSCWEAVQQYISPFMPFEELLRVDKALRLQRYDVAHGSNDKNAKTTLQNLKSWAGVHFPAQAVMPIQNYLQILNNFSSKNRPLVPDLDLAHVFSHRS